MLKDLMGNKFQGELAEGEHTMTLTAWEYMAHATDPTKDYITLIFLHPIGTYKRNFFEKDLTIALSHLRRQLNRSTESIIPSAFFKELIDSKTEFKVWVNYPIVATQNGMRRMQNLHFLEPYGKMEAEAETGSDMEVPT